MTGIKALMEGMILFMKGCRKLHPIWQLWLAILLTANMILPLFFLDKPVALITLVAACSGALIGATLTSIQGFTKLLGLMHGPWIVSLAFQLIELSKIEIQDGFSKWLVLSAGVTFISLVIDMIDVVKFLGGNRVNLLD